MIYRQCFCFSKRWRSVNGFGSSYYDWKFSSRELTVSFYLNHSMLVVVFICLFKLVPMFDNLMTDLCDFVFLFYFWLHDLVIPHWTKTYSVILVFLSGVKTWLMILERVWVSTTLGILFKLFCISKPHMYSCKIEYFDLYSKLESLVTLLYIALDCDVLKLCCSF